MGYTIFSQAEHASLITVGDFKGACGASFVASLIYDTSSYLLSKPIFDPVATRAAANAKPPLLILIKLMGANIIRRAY